MKEVTQYFDPRTIELVRETFGQEGRFNPRTLASPGFAPEKMEDLRKGIQRDGLNHPLLIRINKGKPELVAGERRLRAILFLVNADAEAKKNCTDRVLCKDPKTRRMVPALEAYMSVECKVADETDEKNFLRQAIQENSLHESLTDYEMLLQVQKMEKMGFSRSEQADTLGMSEAWISQSHSLLDAPKCITHYMEKGLLTRTAAITFINVDKEKVEPVLNRAIALTYQTAEDKEKQIKSELIEAKEDLKIAEHGVQLSRFTGNQKSARKARRQAARAGRAIEKAEEKLKSLEKRDNKITIETLHKAAREVDADEKINRPLSMKRLRELASEIHEILDKPGDMLTKEKHCRRDVQLVYNVIECVLNKNDCKHPLDAIKLLKK